MKKIFSYFWAALIPFTFFAMIAIFVLTLFFASLPFAADNRDIKECLDSGDCKIVDVPAADLDGLYGIQTGSTVTLQKPQYLAAGPGFTGMVGGGGGISCSGATNEVGDRTVEATAQTISNNFDYVFRAQADCTGSLGTGYLYDYLTNVSLGAKICVYTSNNASLSSDTSRTLVGCTGAIASCGSGSWCSAAFTAGTVTSGNYYWVAIYANNVGWKAVRTNTATLWYKSGTSSYATPPDPILATGWSTGALAPVSAYSTIQ